MSTRPRAAPMKAESLLGWRKKGLPMIDISTSQVQLRKTYNNSCVNSNEITSASKHPQLALLDEASCAIHNSFSQRF